MSKSTGRRRPGEGLGDYWKEVLQSLDKIVKNYEKVNKLMSILALSLVRKTSVQALRNSVKEGPLLDAGSGPGVIVSHLKEELGQGELQKSYIVAMDPLISMLRNITYYKEPWIDRVRGVFEYPPFRENSFASIVSSFALRDAQDYTRAVTMLSQLLRKGGRFVFVDISKPVSRIGQVFVELYFTIAPVVIGAIVMGHEGVRTYSSMRKTLVKYRPYTFFEKLFRKNGLVVRTRRLFLGFVHIMVAVKPAGGVNKPGQDIVGKTMRTGA